MKKIISYTLAASITATSVTIVNPEGVQAIEDTVELNDSSSTDKVAIEIEDTEKIDEESINNEYENEEDSFEDNEEGTSEDNSSQENENLDEDINYDSEYEEDNLNTDIKDESINDEDTESGEILGESEKNFEILEDTILEEAKESINDISYDTGKIVGKLELDMNFAVPLSNSDKLDIQVELLQGNDSACIIDLSEGILSNEDKDSEFNGTGKLLDSNITFRIEKFNYQREPLSNEDNIYYIKVTFQGLERGTYSLNISGDGYGETKIEDIDIMDYSKRVKIGNVYSANKYNPVLLGGDFNEDSIIDMEDYNILLEKIGSKDSKYDLNRDGKVDIADLSIVYGNMGQIKGEAEVEFIDKIIDINDVKLSTTSKVNGVIENILTDTDSIVELGNSDGSDPSKENPIELSIDLDTQRKARSTLAGVEMEQIIIKAPLTESEEASAPEEGYITYTDESGEVHTVDFNSKNRSLDNEDIIIDLGMQVAVKQISINVTANRSNKNISQIAKIEFLNNVYKELPKPEMNIPVIKTLETSTEMHDERISISWEPQPNVTSYEVKYEKLNDSGQVIKSKKLQTNKTELNILDKDIRPYDIYRVSVQSLNGEWESGYEEEYEDHKGYDGKPDNADSDFNPIKSYYDGDKGSVTEIQVIPLRVPEAPRNLTTVPGYKSFTVNWENHRQARDFDIYYRKVGNSKWTKANENDANGNRLIVSENSKEVTNPNKNSLIRSHSYVINELEDNTTYEVRVTATNHLGTSKMSESYIASTVSVIAPSVPQYKLINKPTVENEIGTAHIVDVRNKKDEDGWDASDDRLVYDGEYAVVDGDFSTSLKCNDWDMGAYYGANRGPEITFDKEYEIGKVILTKAYEQGFEGWFGRVKVTYWDEEGNKDSLITESIETRTSNGQQYHIMKLPHPINAKTIKVETGGGGWQTISELMFYEYDSIEDDIKGLYSDDLRLQIREDLKQEEIDELYERLNTKDVESDEYHPDQSRLLKELDNAQKLFDDKEVSANITTLDASIRTDNLGPSLGMENSYQSLGSVARPNAVNAKDKEKITVYMGSTDSNTRVDIVFLQNYGQPDAYMSKVYTVSPGVTEIEIPTIISADVEKGGQVMARVTRGSSEAIVQVRLSGVEEITHLNVNNMINDSSKVQETKDSIRKYIKSLKTYVNELPSKYPDSISNADKIDNIYLYDEKTSVLNTTDIEGDRFTLTLPATEILKGITQGLNGNEDAEVERLYNALLAWEQEMQVSFAKKGVFEEVKDFNNNGEIDDDDNEYFNAHKAPLTRLNVKYQRMMMGAAAYASSHHIGVGFNAASYVQGVPYKFDEDGNVTNPNEAHLYGTLMGHEIGHAMDIYDRLYPETSNNLLASITNTMLNEDNPQTSDAMNELYKKVTSNTIGLSTNRSVVLGMLWQPYLAYEDNDTYKMLFTDFDKDTSNDSYFAKLNRAYREMSVEERANGDRDQYLIRLTSKVANKNLSNFYMAHGIIPNAATISYVSQFEEEVRPIQYINDEARRKRMSQSADMEDGTILSASFGNDSNGNKIVRGSYVNSKEVKINLSVNKSEENILGYEIYRNGIPCGFIERDKENSVTVYTDTVDSLNNRVVEYKVVAYDYNLNKTNEVELGRIKVRHEGGLAKSSLEISSNTISVDEEHNDIHGSCENEDLKLALDNDENTYYEGRMLEKGEYNSSVHQPVMNPNNDPYIILDTTELKTLVGIKYTAPVKSSGFIFKRSKPVEGSLKKYQIEVSKDGSTWTTVKEGTLDLSSDNPSETIYFDAQGITGGNQLCSYNARYVKIKAIGSKSIAAAEIELITPPGDNIEIGVSSDKVNYKNGIGLLKEDYAYQLDNPDTDENEFRKIPKGSVVITGEYRGNPAFNVPLVLNQDDKHIAEKYNGLLFAKIPDNGDLEEISEGNWVYWVEPQYVESFMAENQEIFAELYRTDSAEAAEGGQRLVSDTFKLAVPKELPEISLSKESSFKATDTLVTMKLNENMIQTISKNR